MSIRRKAWRCGALLALLAVAAPLARAQDEAAAPRSSRVPFKGYLSFRYLYTGSTVPETVGGRFRLTGTFRWNVYGTKITLRYRSNHVVNFTHPVTQNSTILESPYENRHIVQTVAVDTNGLIAPGVKTTVGRFFPEFDYASSPVMDGVAAGWTEGSWSVSAAAGRMVDIWSGKEAGNDIFGAGQVKYKDSRLSVSAGYNAGKYLGMESLPVKKELPVGASVFLNDALWLEAYGSYDFQAKDVARAGLSFSWRGESESLSIMASQWTNPFDQLFILDKTTQYATWGLYAQSVPAKYQDLRVSATLGKTGWGARGSFGLMGGVRSGWLASAAVLAPSFLGVRFSLGGQAMKSDFIQFYSIDAGGEGRIGEIFIRVQSQTRYYEWQPSASDFHNLDNYSELSAEYPIGRHVFLSASGGGYFRKIGNERFQPQAELRLIFRM